MDIRTQLVLAGNMNQFYGWCNEFGFDTDFFKYVESAEDIYGYKDCYIHLVGTYWEKKYYHDVMEYCTSHNIDLV